MSGPGLTHNRTRNMRPGEPAHADVVCLGYRTRSAPFFAGDVVYHRCCVLEYRIRSAAVHAGFHCHRCRAIGCRIRSAAVFLVGRIRFVSPVFAARPDTEALDEGTIELWLSTQLRGRGPLSFLAPREGVKGPVVRPYRVRTGRGPRARVSERGTPVSAVVVAALHTSPYPRLHSLLNFFSYQNISG